MSGRAIVVRPAGPADAAAIGAFLEARGVRRVARLGELIDPLEGRAIVADDAGGRLVGLLTYRVDGSSTEVTALYAERPRLGVGTALLAAAERAVSAAGCTRLWLITTNDSVDALRFYQRRGFRLAALHAGAVDRSRATLKPSIAATGEHGIPIRDELELEKVPGRA